MSKKSDEGLFILRCPDGHEWAERVMLPMNLTAFVSRSRGMDCCPRCAKTKCVMLHGKAYREAKSRVLGPNGEIRNPYNLE